MAEFGGVTGGKKVFNRSLGGGQTAGNYVGARRGVNPYDNGANNRAKARGIIRSNKGLPQRPSIRERQEGCDHGCSHSSNVGYTGMNAMGALGSLGMGAMGMMGSMGSIFNSTPTAPRTPVTPTTPTTPTTPVVDGAVTPTVAEPTTIEKMQQANNSTDLRTAFNNAKQEFNALNAQLPSLKTAAEGAERLLESEKYDAQISNMESNVVQAKKAMNEAKKDVDIVAAEKKVAISTLNQYKEQLSAAGQAYVEAVNNVQTIEGNLQSAKEALANASSDDPNYQTLQTNVTTLETELQNAKNSERNAKTALASAEEKEKDAKVHLDQMISRYESLNTKQQTLIETYEAKKTDYDSNKSQLQQLKQKQNEAKATIKAYEEAQDKWDTLKAALQKEKTRLAKLEEAEAKELENVNKDLAKLDKTNSTLWSKINDDKVTVADKGRMRRHTNNENERLTLEERKAQLEAQIKATVLAEPAKELSDGTVLRHKTLNGKTYYMVNDNFVKANEYTQLANADYNRTNL